MKPLELIFAILVAIMVVCFWINFIKIKPNALEVIEGCFVPYIPNKKDSWLSTVGLVGSVIMPHNIYLHSSLVL